MKISEFIAKTVQAIDAGVNQIESNTHDKGSFYFNDTDGSGQVGITFDIPVDVTSDDPSVFPFNQDRDYRDAPVPMVSFTIRRR